ncbi:unnamed protein product [Pleuronectes platessa]|uniref:Uncharacterized protein n=1 Tax=Pleuronectes platessa TaxID=8262 RepID=A0A9N7W0N0_PLEPL|nr:unnamed protein product [Pleuronectes platessa]
MPSHFLLEKLINHNSHHLGVGEKQRCGWTESESSPPPSVPPSIHSPRHVVIVSEQLCLTAKRKVTAYESRYTLSLIWVSSTATPLQSDLAEAFYLPANQIPLILGQTDT